MVLYNSSQADESFEKYQAVEGSDASSYDESFNEVENYESLQKVGVALSVVGAVGFSVTFVF